MFEIDTTEDAQLILPKRNSASRFQQGNSLLNSGSERKRSLHIIHNQQQSKVRRKIDFLNDQDTLTLFPELPTNDSPSTTISVPKLEKLVEDFKNRGYLDYEIPVDKNTSNSGLSYDGTKLPIKSSFKNKKNINTSHNESINISNGSPLRPIDANSMNFQGNGILPKKASFFPKPDRNNNSRNTGISDISSNQNENSNLDKYKKAGAELAVKISRPPASNNLNTDPSFTKIDLTDNDTLFKNLIQQDKLIDFGDIDNDTIQTSFTNNNNSNTSLPTLPTKNKKARKPFAPKIYDDEVGNKDNTGTLTTNFFATNPNDEDTNHNNNSIVLPKKGVKFEKRNNNIYETNNSIDTMFIAQTVSKQPMLANLNPDETNTNMNMSFNRNPNSSINSSMNTSFGKKNNVKFVSNNNRNNVNKNDLINFNPETNDDEDNDVTKADIDPEFESEHSAILPPMDDHNSIKFNNNSINTNTNNNSANNFIFNANENASRNSGILKNNTSNSTFFGNNSKFGIDLTNSAFDSSLIIECISGLFTGQLAALTKEMRQKGNNQLQLMNSIRNRLNNTSIGNNANTVINILNENKEVVSTQTTLYSLNAINEVLCNIAMCHENKQLLSRKIMHSVKTLKFANASGQEELQRPKGTMKDITDAIALIEERKNQKNNDDKNNANSFIQKYIQLKNSIPFKVHSLNSVKGQFGLNNDSNSVIVKCSYRAEEQITELKNSEMLHVKVSKSQRLRKLKNEMTFLMTVVPDFFFDGHKFSCVISSSDQMKDKKIRFVIVVNIPSFYPWCYLAVESIRVDFGVTIQEVREKIDNILNSSTITPHPLTDLIQALISEYN